MAAIVDMEPVSGYLTFAPDVDTQTITLSTLDDSAGEEDEIFAVRLLSANGGATVDDEKSTSILTSMSFLCNSEAETCLC